MYFRFNFQAQTKATFSFMGRSFKALFPTLPAFEKKETVIELMNFFLESNKMTERIYLDISNISNSTTIVHIATKITKVVLTFQTM